MNGKKIEEQIINEKDLKNIVLNLKLKNSAKKGIDITIDLKIDYLSRQIFTTENFKTVNLRKILADAKIKPGKDTSYNLTVLNNGQVLDFFSLNIQLGK